MKDADTYLDTGFTFCGQQIALKSCGRELMDSEAMSRLKAMLKEAYKSQFPSQSFEEMLAGQKLQRPAWCD